MEDILATSFDSDYHFLGFSKLELDMNAAGSGKVNSFGTRIGFVNDPLFYVTSMIPHSGSRFPERSFYIF